MDIHNGACWDKRLQRLGQGTCNVKDCHSREISSNTTGISRLCNATATVGTDGAVIEAARAASYTNPACRNPSDLTALKKCVVNQTCGNFSSEVVPVCDIDLGCNGMPHDESYKTDFAAVVGTVFATVVALSLLAAIGTHLSRAKAERGLSRTASDYIKMDLESGSSRSAKPSFVLNSVLKDHIEYLKEADRASDHPREDTLVWRSLFFRQKGTLVLRGMSGYLTTGSCVAVIGAPDSGATTLLKVLAGRSKGKMSGEVLLNAKPPDEKLGRVVGYIPKEDIFLPELTARETLQFAFRDASTCKCPD